MSEDMVPRDVAESWKAKAENLSLAYKAQAAEIEKMREALKEMFPLTDNRESYGEKYYRAIRIARAALGETK